MTRGICLVALIVSITLLAPVHRKPAASAVLTIVRSAISGSHPSHGDDPVEDVIGQVAASHLFSQHFYCERLAAKVPPDRRWKQPDAIEIAGLSRPQELVRFRSMEQIIFISSFGEGLFDRQSHRDETDTVTPPGRIVPGLIKIEPLSVEKSIHRCDRPAVHTQQRQPKPSTL